MKKILFFIGILAGSLPAAAQYTMNTTMVPYQDLANPISLNNGNTWDEGSSFQVYYNFNFDIYSQTYTALNVQAGGGLSFPGLGTKELFVFHTPFGGYMLRDKDSINSLSPVSYEITGAAGQKILKIQWKNAGFVQWYSTSDTADFIDYQIWLYESDDHIEIHFGNSSTDPGTYGYPVANSDPSPGPSVKFWFDQCSDVFGLTGPANLPSYMIFNSCNPNYTFIDGTPSTGITYNIFPNSSGTPENAAASSCVFQNPVTDELVISCADQQAQLQNISIVDASGRICHSQDFAAHAAGDMRVPVSSLPAGCYFARMTFQNGQTICKKIIRSQP